MEFDLVTALIVLVGILQLPLIVDGINAFTPARLRRATNAAVSASLAAVIVLISIAALYFCIQLLNSQYPPQFYLSWRGSLTFLVGIYLWLNMVDKYACSVLLPVPAAKAPTAPNKDQPLHRQQQGIADQPGLRPIPRETSHGTTSGQVGSSVVPRQQLSTDECAQYCRACDKYITRRDHHCPFTLTCVAEHNFGAFIAFLSHGTCGLIYACYLTFSPFMRCIVDPLMVHEQLECTEDHMCSSLGSASILLLPAMALLGAAAFLTGAQVLLFLSNLTTIEFLRTLHREGFRRLLGLVKQRVVSISFRGGWKVQALASYGLGRALLPFGWLDLVGPAKQTRIE